MASVFQVAGLRGLSFLPCLIVLGVIAFFYYMYMDVREIIKSSLISCQ